MREKRFQKAAAGFFFTMLIFTLLARAAAGVTAAWVTTDYVGQGRVSDGKMPQTYEACIPLEALHMNTEGYYVYVVETEETVLGEQLIARQFPVSVAAKDSAAAAVEGLQPGYEVVVCADRIMEDGRRVRREVL